VSPVSVEELDSLLLSPDYFQDPYSVYEQLRASDPVHWCAPWSQWIVTGHSDVSLILRQPDVFSSSGWEERFLAQLPGDAVEELPTVIRHYSTKVVSNTDPPEHTRLRKLVSNSFTPRVLADMRPKIAAIVDDTLEVMADSPTVDLIKSFAYPLPATVIALMLGAPERDCHLFEQWSYDIVSFVGTGTPHIDLARREEQSLDQFRSYLMALIEERRAHPCADLLSLLIARSDDGDALTDDELISTCITLLFAGHETTANLIGNMVLALLRDRKQWDSLVAEPALAPQAVEETLRYDSPVQRVRRVARRTIELRGKSIKPGDLVMGFLGSANRDESVFERAGEFDVRRRPLPHTSFGGGVHFCLGAALSRIEAPIAVTALAARFPDMRLADDQTPRYRPNMAFHGLESLQIVLTP
jgi:cytochrome P450